MTDTDLDQMVIIAGKAVAAGESLNYGTEITEASQQAGKVIDELAAFQTATPLSASAGMLCLGIRGLAAAKTSTREQWRGVVAELCILVRNETRSARR